MLTHRCDERCICPIHGTPLVFARATGDHACQDRECVHAHGMTWERERIIVYLPGEDRPTTLG